MNDFIYLWKNREKARTLKRFLIVCVKRILLSNKLISIIFTKKVLSLNGAKIGKLSIINKSTKFNGNLSKLSVGEETSIGNCKIHLHSNVIIGNRVVLNDGVELLTGSHNINDPEWKLKSSPIIIEDYVWIATNALILAGVTIGKGSIIGAGAVIRSSIPEYSIVIGNPHQILEKKRTNTLNYSPVLFNAPYEAWIGRNIKLKEDQI